MFIGVHDYTLHVSSRFDYEPIWATRKSSADAGYVVAEIMKSAILDTDQNNALIKLRRLVSAIPNVNRLRDKILKQSAELAETMFKTRRAEIESRYKSEIEKTMDISIRNRLVEKMNSELRATWLETQVEAMLQVIADETSRLGIWFGFIYEKTSLKNAVQVE
ncbi:MAG: hypothetical protein ACP5GP_06730 [Thermogladius sp.]